MLVHIKGESCFTSSVLGCPKLSTRATMVVEHMFDPLGEWLVLFGAGLRIRDPIHGFIEFSEEEERLINSQLIQRLRRIRQLALAEMVYPGCRHSRFEHSLGVMHLAGQMGERLRLSLEDLRVLRIAALLHDVGHGPFSHVSERCLEFYGANNSKHHELIGVAMIRHDDEIASVGECVVNRAASIIEGRGGTDDSLLQEVLSGPLDVDKLDYLLRDSYYAGVPYGLYDLDHLITIVDEVRGNMVFQEAGLHTIEQLLLARDSMRVAVYGHKVRQITDAMIVRMVELAAEEDERIQHRFTYRDTPEFLEQWRQLDDISLLSLIEASQSHRACSFLRRLRERKLLKRALHLDLKDIRDALLRRRLEDISPSERREIERISANMLDVDPWEVIVNSVTEARDSLHIAPDGIVILRENSTTETFQDLGAVQRLHVPRKYIDLYVPVPDDMDRSTRRQAFQGLSDDLTRAICDVLERGA